MNEEKLFRAIGELIREWRVGAGLTQDELGRRAGIVGKYVSEIERGTRDVPLSTLLAVVERGLRLDLEISFRTPQSVKTTLPGRLEKVALTIAKLGPDQQEKMVTAIRCMLSLAQGGRPPAGRRTTRSTRTTGQRRRRARRQS